MATERSLASMTRILYVDSTYRSQPLIAPTMPPTSLRWAKMKMASAGTIDSAVKAKTRAVSWV